jgi:hypothetical protein
MGLMLTILLAVIASVPGFGAVEVLLAPGAMLAAIPFREGPHSAWPMTWFVLAGLMEAFVLAWPLMLLWIVVARSRRANSKPSERGSLV